ncbi:hypothetical protein [Streptomyces sp. AM6-12]|uniref:hypothetical protein n=1 Tax=Streptomyces sp. AM6-12 TaxID=3345149 RepID=UPI003791EE9C
MALWECAECTTTYAVGLPKCPQCGSTIRVNEATQPPEEQDMPKVTVHGGPSIEGHEVDPETSEVTPIEPEEGEDVSAGTSSSTSSETPSQNTEQSEKPDRSRARGTASRSTRNHEEEGSSARRTATGGRKTAGDHSAEDGDA